MPIYEFYCDKCNVIFNFFSGSIDTVTVPDCPKCGQNYLKRMISSFVTIGHAVDDHEDPMSGLDESKMEDAFTSLMAEAEGMNEDDPRQMARLMRKFTEKTGMDMGDTMEEAISRMEKGEDPEVIEREMGNSLDGDDLFSVVGNRKKATGLKEVPPSRDDKLYRLK